MYALRNLITISKDGMLLPSECGRPLRVLRHPAGTSPFKHLDLWDLKSKPLPRANAPPNNIEPHLDYSHRGVGPYGPEADSQLPASYDYLYVDESR